jgi:hypothetical protein
MISLTKGLVACFELNIAPCRESNCQVKIEVGSQFFASLGVFEIWRKALRRGLRYSVRKAEANSESACASQKRLAITRPTPVFTRPTNIFPRNSSRSVSRDPVFRNGASARIVLVRAQILRRPSTITTDRSSAPRLRLGPQSLRSLQRHSPVLPRA